MDWKSYEAFAGIGAWGKALERVAEQNGDTVELKGYWEFDKYASNAFAAIHGISEDLNYWDITEDKHDLESTDIFFYSPPCQSYSLAGKQEGATVDKGNLFWNALQKIIAVQPKYCIMENVANLANQFKDDFENMLTSLEQAGYVNYNKVLNTKDYGIPQNRERIFIVSIRKDVYDSGVRFEWPNKMKLELRLKDMLEDSVNDEYYLSHKATSMYLIDYISIKMARRDPAYDDTSLVLRSNTLTGYEFLKPGYAIRLDNPKGETGRGRTHEKCSMTITTSINVGVYDGERIRKLTPLECFRLQGFDDKDYYKAVEAYDQKWKQGASDSQMYKRAGNSITVNVIEEILKSLLYQRKQAGAQISLF